MRVIAGSARRLLLKTPKGNGTRPTTDRIKETLFNILAPDISGSMFLDLFSGSGGIGIEALSRGAKSATFVENDRQAIACIKDNISHTGFEEKSKVLVCDVLSAIKKLSSDGPYDIVFMDPPYGSDLVENTLFALSTSNIISTETLIICEEEIQKDFAFIEDIGYEILKEKKYKSNKHVFLKIKSGGEDAE